MLRALRRRFIRVVSKVYDPLTTMNIGRFTINIPMSHALKEIMRAYPEYNFNLARIVKYVKEETKDVKVIDIGANIGDTVAFIKNEADVPILCIDGEEKYFKLLRQNTAQFKDVALCKALVGAENKEVNFQLKAGKGTAHVEEGNVTTRLRTLENILEDYPEYKDSKILKSDTDGFDTIIIRSCKGYLDRVAPILFLEFDPHLIKRNNDDAFAFIEFLQSCGYHYFIFYTNLGDYMLSCTSADKSILNEVIHYFSGRKLDLFADICAFTERDKHIFEKVSSKEIDHFRKVRNY